MRAAQVNTDGLVVNVMLLESDELAAFREVVAPDQLIESPEGVGPGWTFADGEWQAPVDETAPTPEIVPTLSPRQIRLGLLNAGITPGMVSEKLADNPEGLIEWQYATHFERDHPLIEALAGSFGLSDAQVDELWAHAATL